MDMYIGETPGGLLVDAARSHEWVCRVIALLDAAACELDREQAAHRTILEAASLLREQIGPQPAAEFPAAGGGLARWHARKLCAYIDSHIMDRLLVTDLCALVNLSEGYFSRAFRRTFGKTPHAFVIKRRVELAAQYMLQTDVPLSDIALRFGFADQPHLCKHFRRITGHTPSAWRRAHSGAGNDDRHDTRVDVPHSRDMSPLSERSA